MELSKAARDLVCTSVQDAHSTIGCSLANEPSGESLVKALWEALQYFAKYPDDHGHGTKEKMFRAKLNKLAWGWDVEIWFVANRESKTFHKQGRARAVERWAMLKPLAFRCELRSPYTKAEWHRAHGHGGRFDASY
jgi:hypothetical protein